MLYCKYCGKEIKEGQQFCMNCGAFANAEQNVRPANKNKLNIGMIIWSIVNIIVLQQVILGVIAIIFTAIDDGTDLPKDKRNRKVALILNIVASALGVITALFVIFFYFLFILAFITG